MSRYENMSAEELLDELRRLITEIDELRRRQFWPNWKQDPSLLDKGLAILWAALLAGCGVALCRDILITAMLLPLHQAWKKAGQLPSAFILPDFIRNAMPSCGK